MDPVTAFSGQGITPERETDSVPHQPLVIRGGVGEVALL